MVTAVDIGVTVHAIALEHGSRGAGRWNPLAARLGARMEGGRMAFLAHLRPASFEHAPVRRAMSAMAVETALTHRIMFPDEWPPKLGMAGVTGFIDRTGGQVTCHGTAVRVVAIHAAHGPFQDRMARGSVEFGTYAGVAIHADPITLVTNHGWIFGFVGGVASHTAHFRKLMAAAMPIHPGMVIMAGQTGTVLVRSGLIGPETDGRWGPTTLRVTAHVIGTGSVTGLAPHARSRAAGVTRMAMGGVIDRGNPRIGIAGMTDQAGPIPSLGVLRWLLRRPGRTRRGLGGRLRVHVTGGDREVPHRARAPHHQNQQQCPHVHTPFRQTRSSIFHSIMARYAAIATGAIDLDQPWAFPFRHGEPSRA